MLLNHTKIANARINFKTTKHHIHVIKRLGVVRKKPAPINSTTSPCRPSNQEPQSKYMVKIYGAFEAKQLGMIPIVNTFERFSKNLGHM